MAGAFCVELQKAHRRHDLLFCLLVPLIVMLWTGSLLSPGPDELANAYSALFYSIPVDNVLIFPIVMAVLASWLWDMEVKGSTWKLLYTLQSRRSLFLGKALFGIMEVLLVTFLEMGGVFLTGKIYGYTEAFPISQLFYLTGCTLAVELMLFFGAFLLMLLAGNPLLALCAGIIASLTGLFSAFMPKVVSYFVPWGYFVPLGTYEVANWDQAAHTVTYGTRPYNWGLLVFTVVLVMLLFYAAWRRVQKQEV